VAVTAPESESGAAINTPMKAAQGLVEIKESKCWERSRSYSEKLGGLKNKTKNAAVAPGRWMESRSLFENKFTLKEIIKFGIQSMQRCRTGKAVNEGEVYPREEQGEENEERGS